MARLAVTQPIASSSSSDQFAVTDDPTPTPPRPKPAKRSLFKASSWARPTEAEEAIDLFSRAKELFPIVERQREDEKQKKERERRKRKSDEVDREASVKLDAKKRKSISDDEGTYGSGDDDEYVPRNDLGRR